MRIPAHLRYNGDHEWLGETDGTLTVGLTELAADTFGDIVYVDLPSVGAELTDGVACGAVESSNTASDIYSPASGHVVAVNESLRDKPSLVNDDPYGAIAGVDRLAAGHRCRHVAIHVHPMDVDGVVLEQRPQLREVLHDQVGLGRQVLHGVAIAEAGALTAQVGIVGQRLAPTGFQLVRLDSHVRLDRINL